MASLLSGVSESTVPVTGGAAALSQTKLEENLNQFLNLLVTQLKNQDPLEPMDSTEFTSQLVQFASVEQQIYTNASMEKLLNLEETSQISTMVNFIVSHRIFDGLRPARMPCHATDRLLAHAPQPIELEDIEFDAGAPDQGFDGQGIEHIGDDGPVLGSLIVNVVGGLD